MLPVASHAETTLPVFTQSGYTKVSDLDDPIGVAYDASIHSVFVADADEIQHYDALDSDLAQIGGQISNQAGTVACMNSGPSAGELTFSSSAGLVDTSSSTGAPTRTHYGPSNIGAFGALESVDGSTYRPVCNTLVGEIQLYHASTGMTTNVVSVSSLGLTGSIAAVGFARIGADLSNSTIFCISTSGQLIEFNAVSAFLTSETYSFSSLGYVYGATFEPATGLFAIGSTDGSHADLTVGNLDFGAPMFTIQPVDQSVVVGGNPSFTAAASSTPTPTYQWQVSTDAGGTHWTSLADSAPYGGTATGTLTITSATAAMNGYKYRCLASNSVQSDVPSQAAILTVNKLAQTITFPAPGNRYYGAAPFNLSGSASSGLPLIFSVVSGPATIANRTVTLTGAGTVTLAADQAGNATYAAAPEVTHSLTVYKAAQTITFPAPGSKTYGGAPFNVSGSASSGLPVTFSVVSGPATIANRTVTLTGAGTVTIRAVQGGNTSYNAAPSVNHSFTVIKAAQTITFPGPGNRYYGAAPFNLSGSASSGLALTFSVVSGPATISGRTVILTGAGTVTLRASQAGNANYNPATSVDHSLTVMKAVLTAKADDQSKVQGAANPTLTISYAGFVNGETIADIDTAPTASTTATTSSPVGSYPITLSGGSDDNYSFKLQSGTLTVTAGPS
jgi:hypothetical protein